MGEDYSNLQKAMQERLQTQAPLKPSGPKSNAGCIMLVIAVLVVALTGIAVFLLLSLNKDDSTATKSPDNNYTKEKKTTVKTSLSGSFIDAVLIKDKNSNERLWIQSLETKNSKYVVHTYIYDPENKKILGSFDTGYDNYPPQIHLYYINDEVLEVHGEGSGAEPSINTYNPENGELILNTEQYLSKHTGIKNGITKLYIQENPLRFDIESKDGLKSLFDVMNNKVYKGYSELSNSYKNDNQKVKIFGMGYENSSESTRMKLFLVTGPKSSLWEKDIPDAYFTDKSTLKFMRNADATPLLNDKVFLEGTLLYQDDEYCFIFYQSQLGKNAERMLSCVDIKGNMLWTASTENDLFTKLKATDKDVFSEMTFVKNSVHASRMDNTVLFKYDKTGIIGFDLKTGKKLYEIKM